VRRAFRLRVSSFFRHSSFVIRHSDYGPPFVIVKLCDLTLPTPEENLACDEALLEQCEAGASGELLRLWEPSQYFVVVGYANRAATEVDLPYCRDSRLPVLRRCTGGGTVLQGPGCLNYSLFLRIDRDDLHRGIATTNDYILERHQAALSVLLRARVERQGQTDLALGGLKFSGNAQRRKKNFLLFHGSFLLDLDIGLVQKALPMPSRQPEYRHDRLHADFLVNLQQPPHLLKAALCTTWGAKEPLTEIRLDVIRQLVYTKYGLDEWNFKF
jgi:lipoate-protein ligase A